MDNNIDLGFLISEIFDEFNCLLKRGGFYVRLFARQKTIDSIQKKLSLKGDKYRAENRKLQDIIGLRIVCYFHEDIQTLHKLLLKHPNNQPKDNNVDQIDSESFCPQRLNLVFKMSPSQTESLYKCLSDYRNVDLIDNTYEVQLRSVLSEGWHEVEHDLRYKCKKDWENMIDENRMLNGIYATLETSERAMSNLFSYLAYKHYNSRNWEAMLRNHFFIRVDFSRPLDPSIVEIFNQNTNIAKQFLKISKDELIDLLFSTKVRLILNYNNIIFLLNHHIVKDNSIEKLTPQTMNIYW